MRFISDFDVKGRKVLLRVDLNSPVENGNVIPNARMHAHTKTIGALSNRGAKIIVLAHQGRKGADDFTSLEQHAKIVHHILQKPVGFVDSVCGREAKDAINVMKEGDILFVDNVRKMEDESEENGQIVGELSPCCDIFVLDALSIAHRPHASVVGFMKTLPSFAGPVLQEEIAAIEKIRHSREVTFFFGGSKVEDSFAIMEKWLHGGKTKRILVGGALAVLLLYAAGKNIGDSVAYLENAGLMKDVENARHLIEKHGDKIKLPVDVGLSIKMERHDCDVSAIKHGQIWDIGDKTIAIYENEIFNSKVLVANGPAGVYEIDAFSKGTKKILEAIEKSPAFSLLGGGHTISALHKFNFNPAHFGYVSLSGKALIDYLCGNPLPALAALEKNTEMFGQLKVNNI